MSRLLTDVADLAGYDEPVNQRGASSFATALRIRERYAKFPNNPPLMPSDFSTSSPTQKSRNDDFLNTERLACLKPD